MARAMQPPEDMELDMTPMIDVTFQLIIFFVLTMKVKREEGKLEAFLPKDKGQRQTQSIVKKELDDIRIKLVAMGGGGEVEVRIGERSLGPASANPKGVFEALYREVSGLYQATGQPVVIDGDQRVAFRYVVWALDAAVKAKVKEINFTVPNPGQ